MPFERKVMFDSPKLGGPDLSLGLAINEFADGAKLLGHVDSQEVAVLSRETSWLPASVSALELVLR